MSAFCDLHPHTSCDIAHVINYQRKNGNKTKINLVGVHPNTNHHNHLTFSPYCLLLHYIIKRSNKTTQNTSPFFKYVPLYFNTDSMCRRINKTFLFFLLFFPKKPLSLSQLTISRNLLITNFFSFFASGINKCHYN